MEHQVDGGFANVKAPDAIKQIEYWEEQLKDAEFRGAKTILHDLEALKKALHADTPDKAAIKTLVAKLGGETVRSAANAEGAAAEKLKTVGEKMEKAAAWGPCRRRAPRAPPSADGLCSAISPRLRAGVRRSPCGGERLWKTRGKI